MGYLHHQYWPLSPVIPKNTAVGSAISTAWPIVQGHLYNIKVRVPAGHNGLTGFRITYLGQQIMPWSNLAWEIGSGDTFVYEWDEQMMATGLALVCYNTDIVAHQFFATADIVPQLGDDAGSVAGTYSPGEPDAAVLAAIGALTG